MRITTFPTRFPLPSLRREVRYTLVQLRLLPWAKPWVKIFTGLLQEVEAAQVTAVELSDALDDAEAGIDHADATLDTVAQRVATAARAALRGEVLAAFMRSLFGSERPSDFVRPKLGPELARVRTWPTVLQDAPAASLKDLISAVTAAVAAADTAEAEQSAAAAAVAAFQASVHAPLVEKTNGQRKALGGDARKQEHSADGGSVQEGLFLPGPASSRSTGRRSESIEQLNAEIAALQTELAQVQKRLADKQAQVQSQQQADQKRQEVTKQVQDLLNTRAQTDAQIAALQAQLGDVRP